MRKHAWFIILFFGFLSLIMIQKGYSGTLYTIDEFSAENDVLYILNQATAEPTYIGSTYNNLSCVGLAYDTLNGIMYVSDAEMTPGGSFGLGIVNLSTGAVTPVGPFNISDNVCGLAYDSLNDILYGADTEEDTGRLMIVNRTTGNASVVGPFSAAAPLYITGLAYHRASDTLYGINDVALYTINRTTGQATLVGNHGIPDADGRDFGLEVDNDTGGMYACAYDSNSPLYMINKATGASSFIGGTNLWADSLAAVPRKIELIPSINQWGIIALVLLLGFATFWVIAHRRQTHHG